MEIEKLARAIELEKELRKVDYDLEYPRLEYYFQTGIDVVEDVAMFKMNTKAKLESYRQHILDEIKAL